MLDFTSPNPRRLSRVPLLIARLVQCSLVAAHVGVVRAAVVAAQNRSEICQRENLHPAIPYKPSFLYSRDPQLGRHAGEVPFQDSGDQQMHEVSC